MTSHRRPGQPTPITDRKKPYMPWFAIDDGFDSHPKVRRAGNAAAGLFCRLGAFSARHSTDGRVDGVVARGYGTAAQLAKLVAVGLLHNAPHGCDPSRCPQPPEDGYALHDYLFYNRSRAQVEAAREAGRKRQQKGRETQKQERTGPHPSPTRDSGEPQVSPGWASDAPQNESRFSGSAAGHASTSRRDTLQGPTVVPSPPIPSPVPPTEVQLASKAAGPHVPDFARELVTQMTVAGMVVGWRLGETEWFSVHAHVKRCGVPAMVDFARRRWNPADPPQTARYLTRIWADLPDMPQPEAGLPALRAVSGGNVLPLSTTDQRVQQGLDLAARFRAIEEGQQ